MNKEQLIIAIAAELPGMTKRNINRFLDTFTKVVSESVADGEKITIVGFGTFESVEVKKRNPKTNEAITGSVEPKFTPGKNFKEKVLAASK